MGIPVYAMQGKGGGITLLDNFLLVQSLLSTKEKEQILTALQGIIATEQNNSDKLLTEYFKIGGSETRGFKNEEN